MHFLVVHVGFCVQGGDPTGTGFGEYTVYFYVVQWIKLLL